MLDVEPKTPLTSKLTPIELKGLAGLAADALEQVKAEVEVRNKDTNELIRTLKVIVLPLMTVDLGIYRIEDSVDLAKPIPKSKLDPALPNNADIIKTLNREFIQCGVRFFLNADSHDYIGAEAIRFDVGRANGILDSGAESDPEIHALAADARLNKGKLNLLIIHGLEKSYGERKPVGFCPWREPFIIRGKQVFVFSEYFESAAAADRAYGFPRFKDCCGHELGHALGLSTRLSYRPSDGVTVTPPGHDMGLFPGRRYHQSLNGNVVDYGLMWWENQVDSRWMRHEDWIQSNEMAKGFRKP